MLQHHIPYEYVDAVIDRRIPRPAHLLELAARREARRERKRRR